MPTDMVFWLQESERFPENPAEFLLNRTRCVMKESGKVLSDSMAHILRITLERRKENLILSRHPIVSNREETRER